MPPALALIGAAASIGGGMAAVGGTMAGFLGAGLGAQLVGGAMIAGGVMSGLGIVTGNKKLQKWGGILSIAGGVGGLATGAWSSAANGIANDAASAGFGGAEYGMAEAAAAGSGGLGGSLGAASGALSQANAGALGTTDIGIGGASAGGAPMGATPPTTVNLVNAGGTQGTAGGFQGAVDGIKQRVSDMLPGTNATGGGMLSSIGDKVKPAFDWMEKNPRITQAGTGLLTAGLSGYAQQQAVKDQMRLQEEAQARARQRMSDSVQGVNVPVYQRKGG